jgi:hypothetical protein
MSYEPSKTADRESVAEIGHEREEVVRMSAAHTASQLMNDWLRAPLEPCGRGELSSTTCADNRTLLDANFSCEHILDARRDDDRLHGYVAIARGPCYR